MSNKYNSFWIICTEIMNEPVRILLRCFKIFVFRICQYAPQYFLLLLYISSLVKVLFFEKQVVIPSGISVYSSFESCIYMVMFRSISDDLIIVGLEQRSTKSSSKLCTASISSSTTCFTMSNELKSFINNDLATFITNTVFKIGHSTIIN